MAKKDGNYRAWLGLELADEQRNDLELWLRGAFGEEGADGVTVVSGPGLIMCATTLAGRQRQALEPLADSLRGLDPGPIRVEFAGRLRALPNRQRPHLYVLPGRCLGLAAMLRKLSAQMPPASFPARPGRAAPYLLVGHAGAAAQPPRQWPPPLPRRLRGPLDAVRLGLYCSQITPENHRLDPLAQVELPVAAAVR